jgi:hypothetical protein
VEYTWWDALKDFLGAIGPVLIAWPWLVDFFLRKRRAELQNMRVTGKLAQFREDILREVKGKMEAPQLSDLVLTLLGLACVCASFIIAFCPWHDDPSLNPKSKNLLSLKGRLAAPEARPLARAAPDPSPDGKKETRNLGIGAASD